MDAPGTTSRAEQIQVSSCIQPGIAAELGEREEGWEMPTSPPDQIPAATHHLLQLVGRLLHSLSVVAVHHEDKTLREKPGWSRQLAQ